MCNCIHYQRSSQQEYEAEEDRSTLHIYIHKHTYTYTVRNRMEWAGQYEYKGGKLIQSTCAHI
jgi:hypothetical protein